MPLIYEARCSKCNHTHIAPAGHMALQLDDGSLVILHHPGETMDLENAGFTWKQAERDARLVTCDNYLCKECGGLYEVRCFSQPTGCLTPLSFGLAGFSALAAIIAAVLMFTGNPVRSNSLLITLTIGACAFAVAWVSRRRESRSFARAVSMRPELRIEPCCADMKFESHVPIDEAGGILFPCPSCGQRDTVSVKCMGIS